MNDVLERAAPGFRPKVALILGSGLGGFAEDVAAVATIAYDLGYSSPSAFISLFRRSFGHTPANYRNQL